MLSPSGSGTQPSPAGAGMQPLPDALHAVDLDGVRAVGAAAAARHAVGRLGEYWVHLDVDVLDDAVMPAVDYRLPGGLSWTELESVLRTALADERAVGFDVTIFNPRLDPDGSIAARLVECLRRVLRRGQVAAEAVGAEQRQPAPFAATGHKAATACPWARVTSPFSAGGVCMAWRCAGLSWPRGARMPVLAWEGGRVSPLTAGKELGFRAEGPAAVCRGARESPVRPGPSWPGGRRRRGVRSARGWTGRTRWPPTPSPTTPGRTASISPGSVLGWSRSASPPRSAGPRGCWSRGPSSSAGWGAGR